MKKTFLPLQAAKDKNSLVRSPKTVIPLFLRRFWQEFCLFMVDKSRPIATSKNRKYSEKVRFYPYLSKNNHDEPKDWLEVTFNSPNTHF